MYLRDLKKGDKANVVTINTGEVSKLRKLSAFGILQGVSVSILQTYPAIIVQIGYTQVALDDNIAGIIEVDKQ